MNPRKQLVIGGNRPSDHSMSQRIARMEQQTTGRTRQLDRRSQQCFVKLNRVVQHSPSMPRSLPDSQHSAASRRNSSRFTGSSALASRCQQTRAELL
jgi:hypothetical protein